MDLIATLRPAVKNVDHLLFARAAKGVEAADEMQRVAKDLQRG